MKKKNGFTLIEMAVTFCLVAAVSILLFQIIANMKELYLSGDVKTTLLNRQAIMTKKIYDQLNNEVLVNVSSCGSECVTFRFANGDVSNFSIDHARGTISYGNYQLTYGEGSQLGSLELFNQNYGSYSILNIALPVTNKMIDGDYGIQILVQYTATTTVAL